MFADLTSDCAETQADLELHCQMMTEGSVSDEASHIKNTHIGPLGIVVGVSGFF